MNSFAHCSFSNLLTIFINALSIRSTDWESVGSSFDQFASKVQRLNFISVDTGLDE